jgi:hypothetical protein
MIVRDTDTIKKYVAVNSTLTFDNLKSDQIERKYIKPLLGATQYAVFDVATVPADAIVKEAYELAQEAISFLTLYEALPNLALQITDAGIFQASTDSAQIASEARLKDLLRSTKRRGLETLDEMLLVMENNLDKFTEWSDDTAYKKYTALLVNSTAVFNKHYNIFNSRQTFMALYAEIETVEYQFIEAPVGKVLLAALKTPQDNPKRIEAKTLLQKAIVCFTIAKVAQNGLFIFDASGIHVRFDVLPYEQINSATSNDKFSGFLKNTAENKHSEGEQYLKNALEIITTNASEFTEYTAPVDVAAKKLVHTTKSITLI